jgi:hypothetical protein
MVLTSAWSRRTPRIFAGGLKTKGSVVRDDFVISWSPRVLMMQSCTSQQAASSLVLRVRETQPV